MLRDSGARPCDSGSELRYFEVEPRDFGVWLCNSSAVLRDSEVEPRDFEAGSRDSGARQHEFWPFVVSARPFCTGTQHVNFKYCEMIE